MPQKRDRDRALDVLISLADAQDAARVRERIGVEDRPDAAVVPDRWVAVPRVVASEMPASARLWMLEADRPEINEVVVLAGGLAGGLEAAVLRGEPFGPASEARWGSPGAESGGGRTLPLAEALRNRPMPEGVRLFGPGEVVPALRAVRTMRQGRSAANACGRADWTDVIEVDAEQPLPGFARWALALRVDCPAVLRARFSDHPSYAYRMRRGGIVDSPAAYAREWRSALTVLAVLDTGRWAFPARLAEAEAALRPLVRGSLGGNVEAWAVLAQLLPTFTGTVPELIVTSGAIA